MATFNTNNVSFHGIFDTFTAKTGKKFVIGRFKQLSWNGEELDPDSYIYLTMSEDKLPMLVENMRYKIVLAGFFITAILL